MKIFIQVKNLLKHWGISTEHWLVTGKYSRRFSGFPVPLRKNHINIVVESGKIPWHVRYVNFAETIPAKQSRYSSDYMKFSYLTDYNLDITPVDGKLFNRFKKNRKKITIGADHFYSASIFDNLYLAKIKLDHCTEQELGVQKGIRLLEAIRELSVQAKRKHRAKVVEECQDILQAYRFHFTTTPVIPGELRGIPLGRGKVEGKVAVFAQGKTRKIYDPMILVTDEFTPKQLVYFNELLAVITETGGLVSHAAIVSKEYHLPVVLQVSEATKLLKDGQYVRIHFNTGRIEKIRV